MTRFFFHVHDEIVAIDEEGSELPGLEAAIAQARAGAIELMCEQLRKGALNLGHAIVIEDELGATIVTLRFGELVTIRP